MVEWCLGFIDPKNPIGIPKSRHDGRLAGRGILGEKTFIPELDAYEQAHFLVLQHTEEVSIYSDEYKEVLRQENPECSETWIAKAHMKGFSIWFRDRMPNSRHCSQSLQKLSRGPLFTITNLLGVFQ